MKKNELIDVLSKKTETSKAESEKFVNAFIDTIVESLKNKETIDIYGFGKFEAIHKDASTGRNPKTGEITQTPAKEVPKFKFSSTIKKSLNE